MPITTGDFQDLVQLSQDTLYYVGPDFQIGNTSVGSSASIGFNNTAGDLQLVGVATGNATAWLPAAGGTLATQVTLSNSNNISFGLNASTITASYAFNASAGTTSNNLNALTFSNSNGISFGLNGSTMTGSVATSLTNINVSAGTTSNNLSAITFSNSNGISFGLNGSTMTGSVATSLTNIKVSAGAASANLSAITFSNSNGISFGLNASVITAKLGGMSSWSNAPFPGSGNTFTNNGSLSLQPVIIPYVLTATNIVWVGSLGSVPNFSFSAALYSLNGGSGGSLSMASSASTFFTGNLASVGSVNYMAMSCTWVITPGVYLFAYWMNTAGSGSITLFGAGPVPPTFSNPATIFFGNPGTSNQMLGGVWPSTAAFPASFAMTNTASYLRSSGPGNQPWILLQGS